MHWILAVVIVTVIAVITVQWVRAGQRPAPVAPPEPYRLPPPDPNVFMPRGFDFYVRLETARRTTMLDAITVVIGTDGTLYDQETHGVVLWHGTNPPMQLLQLLSSELNTQVVWLAFQKQVDAFEYARWENGTLMRHLVFGCYEQERAWEHVEGEPEPWEAAAIFEETRLERRFSQARRLSFVTYTPEDEKELRRIWRERRLVVGNHEPNISGRNVAEAAALANGLPGWS
jgi:hypothetical protein